MKNIFKLKAIRSMAVIALAAVIGFTFAACGGGGGSTETYSGTAANNIVYTLRIEENTGRYAAVAGDYYTLTSGDFISKGTVTRVANSGGETTFTLRHTITGNTFTAVVLSRGLIRLPNRIWWDNGQSRLGPGNLTPGAGL